MEDIDRFKTYAAMAETSRKWTLAFDAKAGFLSALCFATLTFIWSGAKLAEAQGCVRALVLLTTVMLLLSLGIALNVVLPRVSLRHVFGRDLSYVNHHPISFFGYVAKEFPPGQDGKFVALVDVMDAKAFAREALEQHYTTCHVLQRKSQGVVWSGWIWLAASILVVVALALKG